MVKKDTHEENTALTELLKQEAEQTRPVFSGALHARICRAVDEADMAERPRPVDRRRLVRVIIDVAVVASLVVGVFYLLYQGATPNPITPNPDSMAGPGSTGHGVVEPEPEEDLQTPIDMPVNTVVDIGLLVDSTLTNGRWAYLDHDAQLAANMLLDQLPSSVAWPAEEP